MKITTPLSFLCIVLFFSCSKQMSFVNHTGKEVNTMVFLSESDVSNHLLGYDNLKNKNILTKALLPKESLILDKSKEEAPYCIYYEDTDYNGYFVYNPTISKINLSADDLLNYPAIDYMPDTLGTVEIKIDNQSNYYIRYVIIESEGFPETYYAMNQWNIIDTKKKEVVQFNAYEKGDRINSITLVGMKDGRKKEIKYTEELEDYLLFTDK